MLKSILIVCVLTNLLLANTIKCLNQPIGSTITIDNKQYFVADDTNIKKKINHINNVIQRFVELENISNWLHT